MKKIILNSIAVALFVCCGSFANAMNPLRQALIDVGNKDAAVAIYNGYSPTQKKAVWVDKIDQCITTSSWSSDQLNSLTKLKDKAIDFGFNGTEEEIIDLKNWTDNWIINAKQVFNYKLLRQIGTLVMDINTDYIIITPGGDDCKCAEDSDFCIAPGDKCVKNKTCRTGGGCGLFWAFTCNGNCVVETNLGVNNSTSNTANTTIAY